MPPKVESVEVATEDYKKLPKTKMGMKAGKKTLSGIGHALKSGTDGVGSIESQKREQQANKKGKQADKIHNVAAKHSPELSKMKSLKNKLKGMVKEDGAVAAPTPQQTNIMKQRAMMDAKLAQLRRQQLNKDQAEKSKMKESTEDSLRDRRMERGGVDGNVRYDRAPKVNTSGKGKKKPSGQSAFDFVKADLEKKYGKGAIISNKKG